MYLLTGGKPEGITIVINHVYKGKINEKKHLITTTYQTKPLKGETEKGRFWVEAPSFCPLQSVWDKVLALSVS